ncbi:unnamed protein product [Bursaphelenchus okinawaensis]|uniref:Carboxylesterase type B domain-containing protein n=1 Tax=Bursaphelenchus okinawaensis TaxID=465554 RepID=A0A811L0Q5_9BILA|nr:unnamed protein product [Bursaphelenchus okinawaensis]CAG9115388.1 unnamed protein product [Bursaphelenchus okinawaensis]
MIKNYLIAFCVLNAVLDNKGCDGDQPVLNTHIGKFYGELLEFESGIKVDAFYGVPYAKKPIGELRFEKPEDAEYVKERSATTRPKACLQAKLFLPVEASEDCLYVNVFRPHEKIPSGNPALFFIHGGGYQAGSAQEHSEDYVAEYYAGSAITVVVPQYRLNFYGFATTKTSNLPGNLGLHDLNLALDFVHKNAESLNIDVTKITVAGYSAGSAAASVLSLSPLSHDKFAQVIQFSGSTLAEWAFNNRGYEHTKRVIKILNCDQGDVKKCLKEKSVDDIDKAMVKAHMFEGEINHFDYGSTLDDDFFKNDPESLVKSAKPKVTLGSLNENEGLLFTIYFPPTPQAFKHALTKEQKQNFGIEDFTNFVQKTIVMEKLLGEEHKAASDEIIDFYLKSTTHEEHTRTFYLDMHAKVLGDVMFVVPQLRELKLKQEAGWPVYNILSTYSDYLERTMSHIEVSKTSHATEYRFLFGIGFNPHDNSLTETDEKYRKLLVDSVVNFIKTGSPKSTKNQNFTQTSKDRPLVYTDLNTKATVKDSYFGKEFEFWSNFYNKYQFDVIRGEPKKTLKHVEL